MSALTDLTFSTSHDLFSAVSNRTKTCAVCKETKTEKYWYKDLQDSTAFRCLSCYKKACYDNRNKRGLDEQPLSEKKRKTMTLSLSPEEEEATVPRGLSLPLSPG